MNIDIRIKVSFHNHPKTKKFTKSVGEMGGWMLIKLWSFTAQNKPDGRLTNMSAKELCDVMEWKGNRRVMIHALLDCMAASDACVECDNCEKKESKKRSGWIDRASSEYRVHAWSEHNPYVSGSTERSARAKKGAAARWEKESKQILNGCSKHETAYAPSPAPSPSPSPAPAQTAKEHFYKNNGSGNGKSVDAMGRPLKTFR